MKGSESMKQIIVCFRYIRQWYAQPFKSLCETETDINDNTGCE